MGLKVSKCEADPTIVPPPPPGVAQGQAAQPGQEAPSGPVPYVSESMKNNPGSYDELHKKVKELFPQPFEGAKVMINKALNQGFHISHSISLSTINPSGYRFGATYIGTEMINPQDPALVMISDCDPSGNVNAQGVYALNEAFKVKYALQIMNSKFANTQVTAEYRGRNWTASSVIVNPNVFNNTGIGVVQLLYAINPKICIGGEVMHQRSPQIPEGALTLFSLSGRYTGAESVWSAFGGTGAVGLSYYRRITEELQVGLDIENNFTQQQFLVGLGYQFDLPKANFSMKGMIDNNWTVTGVLEKRLLPMPFMLSLCGSLNHVKNQFRLGCGFTIGA